jgi:hypothetical protein
MSDSFDPADYGLEPVQESVPRNWRRQMEADKKAAEERAQAAEARLAAIEAKALFGEAGIPDTPLGQMFTKSYEGERTVAAVQAGWQALVQTSGVDQRVVAGHQAAQAMAAGAPPASSSNLGSDLAAMKAHARAVKNPMSFNQERIRLSDMMRREGIEMKPADHVLPGQLVQSS